MKKPVILLIVLAALIAFAFFYEQGLGKRVNSARLTGADLREYLLPNLAADQVRKIRIREGGKEANLVLDGTRWTVTERSGYPASFEKIKRAVQSLADMKIKGKDVIGKSVLGEVKLLAPTEGPVDNTGLQVELLNEKGEAIASLVAGSSIASAGGASSGQWMGGPGELRYVRTPGDKDTVWIIGDSFYELSSDTKEWLEKAFLDVRKVKAAEITAANATDSWHAERADENSEFKFVNAPAGDELDTAKASGLSSVLSAAYFTDVVPKDKANAEFMKGALKAKVTTFEGFTYELDILEKKEDANASEAKTFVTVKVSADIPKERKAEANEKDEDKTKKDEEFASTKKSLEEKLAKEKNSEGWVYEISNYSVNALLKKRSELLREKTPPAPSATAPAPLSPSPSPLAPPAAPAVGNPPVSPTPPTSSPAPTRTPVTVTTPPISVDLSKPGEPKVSEAPKAPEPKPTDAKKP
ncbi:MAG: DUF4340 domain-containing protein [Roseimicrobium sp.]